MVLNYSDEEKFKDMEADKKLRQLAQKECDCVGDDRVSRREKIEKAKDRLDILAKIEEFERNGLFDKDTEEDPPTIPLLPEGVDQKYSLYRMSSKCHGLNARL